MSLDFPDGAGGAFSWAMRLPLLFGAFPWGCLGRYVSPGCSQGVDFAFDGDGDGAGLFCFGWTTGLPTADLGLPGCDGLG